MARDYKKAYDWRVHEYLPLTFDVGDFRRRFSRNKHREVMKELNQRVAELEKDRVESTATTTIWVERVSGWLQPLLGCLPFEVGNHPADGFQEDESKRHSSINSNMNNRKV
ncbi:uncharacterized protein EKO05_0005329 [Ascochyta rabiei]|uniref:uncharacterized protein n=1 Tax=Didymella rabiei TaxID=5454 RepID=UPI0021FEF186|nr:uncharacterized protein EKO05_0005329 [Ascochyta rabiei]UPX14858.1 hypothetical protein EKO05_0005329 [Ascochyta rabiei]